MGLHRFIHTLDVFGSNPPALPYDPAQVDPPATDRPPVAHVSTVFVTGGTGLTGANVCEQLIDRGDAVRALVRNPDEADALAAIGVELVQGDITDADDVVRAAKGCDARHPLRRPPRRRQPGPRGLPGGELHGHRPTSSTPAEPTACARRRPEHQHLPRPHRSGRP